MKEHYIKTYTATETIALAQKLAIYLKPGDVIILAGDLGAGKTTFAKGIANGLGVKRTVSSPTFTIVKEYEGEIPFYHMDAYRLENSDEDIGFSEYFNGNGVSVVEWAQFIETYLPADLLNINITYVDELTRKITFTATSMHFEWVVNELMS